MTMRYESALNYMEKHWPKTAAWVEETLGSRSNGPASINADLAVAAMGEHQSLVHGGLLVWIASGKPVNQPQNGWPCKDLREAQKMFMDMDDKALKAYLDGQEKSFAPVIQPPPIPVRPPVTSNQPPPIPMRPPVTNNQPPPFSLHQPMASSVPMPLARSVPGNQPPPIPLRSSPPPGRGSPVNLPPPINLPPPLTNRLPPMPTVSSAIRTPNVHSVPLPSMPSSSSSSPVPLSVRPRRLSKGPGILIDVAELVKWIEAMDDLKSIFVCDIPTGVQGVYLTEKSTTGLVDNSKINIARTDRQGGWLNLGRGVLTNRMGKCWSCAAAVIHKLVTDPRFDAVRIESIGASGYDHHFVVINRDSATTVADMSTWNKDAILIDAWQANLTGWTMADPSKSKKAQLAYLGGVDFPYKSVVRFFCAFEPADRVQHREAAGEVGKSVQGATITRSWELMRKCYLEHFSRGVKSASCPVSGFCDKK
jgi:hypothetical protein